MRNWRRKGAPESIDSLLEKTISGFGLKKKSDQWKVVQIWPSIVGANVAKLSRPLYVTNGILIVGTPSSSWAQELDFQKPEILRRISAALGEGIIRDIRFQGTTWKEEKKKEELQAVPALDSEERNFISSTVEKIESAELRKAVEKLLIRWMVAKRRPSSSSG